MRVPNILSHPCGVLLQFLVVLSLAAAFRRDVWDQDVVPKMETSFLFGQNEGTAKHKKLFFDAYMFKGLRIPITLTQSISGDISRTGI